MKLKTRFLFVLCGFFSVIELYGQASLDTVIIKNELLDKGIYYPARPCYVSLDKDGSNPISYIDSIKINRTIIDRGNQRYYLILQNTKGQKILEGEFFDEFADGHMIAYYPNGMKKFEGDYQMLNYKKPKTVCKVNPAKLKKKSYSVKVGIWKYYTSYGELITTKVMKNKR